MNKTFEDYFYENVDYAMEDMLAGEILSLGQCRWYLASSFLNGVVNYFQPLSAFVIHRYTPPSEGKKHEFDKAFNSNTVHTELCIGDDVLLLGKAYDTYCFFWFDCDVSDCAIGRFQTEDPEHVVIKRFEEYVQRENFKMTQSYLEGKYSEPAWEIPLAFIKGWVSF